MARHEALIRSALRVASTSACKWRHGAVAVRGSRVMAAATNSRRNDPTLVPGGATWHAEEAVIRMLLKRSRGRGELPLRGYTLYVARVDIKNEPQLSRPCLNCWEILKRSGISLVYYTDSLGSVAQVRVPT
ncbi:hypothetical protein [Streptomyces sp. 900105245]